MALLSATHNLNRTIDGVSAVVSLDDRNATEWGYGQYLNVRGDGIEWASICLPRNADPSEIQRYIPVVLARARRAMRRWQNS